MRDDAAAESRRLAMEAEAIDRALESVAAGRVVTEAQFDAWVDSLGTDHELPPPRSGK
jgi:predicted transcriptional regulator